MIKKLCILVFSLGLFSCNQQKESEANTDLLYFDVKGYFGKEIARLRKLKPSVNKTVSINETNENKILKITDWEKELAIFLNADINKTSWKGSFVISKQNGSDVYTSSSKKIPVKIITVKRDSLRIRKIEIIIAYQNILYQSHDTLSYYPDSLYEIKKEQKIRFLKEKKYSITGKMK